MCSKAVLASGGTLQNVYAETIKKVWCCHSVLTMWVVFTINTCCRRPQVLLVCFEQSSCLLLAVYHWCTDLTISSWLQSLTFYFLVVSIAIIFLCLDLLYIWVSRLACYLCQMIWKCVEYIYLKQTKKRPECLSALRKMLLHFSLEWI